MDLNGASVLVTGGAGFIGSHLVEALVAEGAEVTVVDDSSQGSLDNLEVCLGNIEYLKMDFQAPEVQDLIVMRQFDVICHLASNASVPFSIEDPEADFCVNLLGTFQLIETIRLGSPETIVVYFSSAAVYGDPGDALLNEATQLAPISPYGVSKLAADQYVSLYSHLYGLNSVILRPLSAYGPRLRKQVIYDLINKLDKNPQRLQIHGDGSQIRDFCYVDDIVNAALVTVSKGSLNGEIYNVGSGKGCSIKDLANLISVVMDVHPRFIFSGDVRPGVPQKWVGDITKLQSIGYSPKVGLNEGIHKTYLWYKQSISSKKEDNSNKLSKSQVKQVISRK